MAVQPVVKYPDSRLRTPAQRVTDFDAGLQDLAGDLLETLRAIPAIGITGPHIGVLRRIVVLALPDEEKVRVYVNPHIIWQSEDKIRHVEGSISLPGVSEEVERHARVKVAYQDLEGVAQTEEADGFLAVCHQHEIDQLDGLFWLQRLSRLKRERLLKRHEKALRQLADTDAASPRLPEKG
ncbi:peptide deformylase [Xanthobacter sp. TB0136]|uniref:peptide deformylase n=1 Tax=Xanthobacter sp. TB0136 TaxID=3459177 RepID=UPI00403A01BD